ncbi:putative RNA-binding protein Luc7-like 2 [Acropora cervicornis]|uniref:RNA-binding protein Luc7-like 2 n=1 Tax=Acropora cervicornis TaxID=6130 RepID=A0AAD9VFG4_ACRCE|nr:putative RNA-binding protein Luc7-like 2 [Acropora cervicornis]
MGLCPHELFNNTKMDLGPCNKIHEAALKADFELASKNRDFGYDIDQMEHLQSFIKDCDRKIQIAKKRLEETQDDHEKVPEAQAVHDLAEQIGKKLAEAEAVGAEGKVDESIQLMKEVDDLKAKKRLAEDVYRETLPSSSLQQQKLRVCEVCAAYLSLYDNDRRLADHFGGKLHMGFIKIRDRLKELQDGVAKKRADREMERMRRREERERVVQNRVPDLVLAPSLAQETSLPTAIDPAPAREVPREDSHPPRDHGPDQEAKEGLVAPVPA